MFVLKYILIILSLSITLIAYDINEVQKILTPNEIVSVEKGILQEAERLNNYDDITTIAISFYATSKNRYYTGDKSKLEKKALELLTFASNKNNLNASLFLMLNVLKDDPLYARAIAKKIIKKNMNIDNKIYKKLSKTFITTFVALTLDHFSTNIKELNFALEILESLNNSSQVNLYRAFLFKALDSDDMADIYLNKACNSAKSNKIVSFCKSLEL